MDITVYVPVRKYGETPREERCQSEVQPISIHSLAGNTRSQQKEADEGTLMAVRSAWAHKKQVAACRGLPGTCPR